MRATHFHLHTLREVPADAEVESQRLMLRAGMIRKLGAGLYTWTPLGLRVLRKVERVVREEMEAIGALELLMPAVQPAELWQETGRWEQFGGQLLKIRDRAGRDYCFGPTHEEVITDFARAELRSYRQLPRCFFQIQTKFRDEIRPRFGVMRAREFLMKDAYSFHIDAADMAAYYEQMYGAYARVCERLGLAYRAVMADTGAIGGAASHEFHVLAESGEDVLMVSDESRYASNLELTPIAAGDRAAPGVAALGEIATPSARTIDEVAAQLGEPAARCVKTLIVRGRQAPLVALLVRGDHTLNEIKAAKQPLIATPLAFADEAEIRAAVGAGTGSLGPVGLNLPIVADHAVLALSDFVCGANRDGFHLTGVNFGRDLPWPDSADLRNAIGGDASPDGVGRLRAVRGIEVGHVFQLGQKYAQAMGLTVLDERGQAVTPYMGCYGIGVSRIVAAAIEQGHDARGIRWPAGLAPFAVALCPLGANKSPAVTETAEQLYQALLAAGVEVLLDDRGERPGVMFADHELIGIAHRLVVSDRGLAAGQVEYKARDAENAELWPAPEAIERLSGRLALRS